MYLALRISAQQSRGIHIETQSRNRTVLRSDLCISQTELHGLFRSCKSEQEKNVKRRINNVNFTNEIIGTRGTDVKEKRYKKRFLICLEQF